MDPQTQTRPSASRRSVLAFVAGLPITAATLSACGSSGPGSAESSGGGGTGASFWTLSGKPQEDIRQQAADEFNEAHSDTPIEVTLFQNDAYKQKVKTALGAGQAPTILWGWGGGGLKSWVDAGQVEDLTSFFDENGDLKDKIFPAAFGAATVDDTVYALPCETVTPIVLYWNKAVFDQVGVQPPQSWSDILDLVPAFNDKGIAPFSLGGQSRWTNMMWLEFLFDRIGGPEVFQAVFDGEKDAWSNPDAIKALTEMQKLIEMNGFVKGFASITADSNADQALLYTGKAAMMLHGAWTYGGMKNDGGDFVSGGNLGYMNFPAVEGGKGDPSNSVGNPAQYLSISSKASDEEKKAAMTFLAESQFTESIQQAWIDSGNIPVAQGSDALIGDGEDADWLKFQYDIASNANSFVQSWDQALPPAQAEVLLDNIAKLFQMSIGPEEFATNLNAVIGT
ncbi:extracellular solute-binding protein [Phycicoccus sp. CSK15P-2]|uniref:extracellular solute-binding protein n=1 Tax=Phycicoccus sp. CSK15P-2 TaxID=2807627 RepID=UPI00194EFA8F|nr:extracellular solute-binding protein [Phycicoccus sp. CSK15P-2]MBM6403866.1 extracellular solute-binding protein [Phycicoccus sp. CSK15P-2]